MLILSRKTGESILIGENIYITVSKIEGEKVKIGVSAPKNVPVYRTELLGEKDQNASDRKEG